jgi:hypothetical protein
MIGIISSTIYPPALPTYDGQRSCIPPALRLEQTRKTIESLSQQGISEIYLADNSGELWEESASQFLKPAKVAIFKQHQYRNKGISELYLLLNMLEQIPVSLPILKISGRYSLSKNLSHELGDADLAVKIYRHRFSKHAMSTRCYLVKNKEVYATFLKRTLQQVYAYPSRIVGPRSLVRIVRNSFFPGKDNYPYDDPSISIEGAAASVLKIYNYKFNNIEDLGVEGQYGSFKDYSIKE